MTISTLGMTRVKQEAAIAWARARGAHDRFVTTLIPLYYEIAPLYDLPAENLVCQSGKETNWGHFTGVVPAGFKNPAGIKTRDGGGNNDPEAHMRFPNWRAGVEAHCSHLAKYGGLPESKMPAGHTRSPRLVWITTGSAPTLADLGGKYAPSPTYGIDLEKLVDDLLAFAAANGGLIDGSEESPVSVTETIRDRIIAKGVEVHDIRESMIWHESKTYDRLSNTAWQYVGVHHTGVHREPRALDKEIGSWVNHSVYHVKTRGWPGIAYAIGISLSGRVFILRDLEYMGYHAFDANENTLAIAGDLTTGDGITPEFERSLFAVLDVIHEAPEFPNITSRADTYGHQELKFIDRDNAGTECPGDVLQLVKAYRDGADVPDAGERAFPETGFTIRGRIRDFWERAESANVGYQGIGLPISAEYDYEHDGRKGVRQDFERASLFYEADKPFPWDVTALPVRVHHEGLVDSDLLRSIANALRGIVKTLDEAVDE